LHTNNIAKGVRLTPGPGHYPPAEAITRNGVYVLSRFSSSRCRRFGSEVREGMLFKNSIVSTPGPGAYRSPSEFGHYQAQDKYIKECEKTDVVRKSATATPKTRSKANQHQAGLRSSQSNMNHSSLDANGRRNKSTIVEGTTQTVTKATN